MNIFTLSEQQDKKYSPAMAITAAAFILETRTGIKQKLNVSCLSNQPKKVTLVQVNKLTDQIIADTQVVYQ